MSILYSANTFIRGKKKDLEIIYINISLGKSSDPIFSKDMLEEFKIILEEFKIMLEEFKVTLEELEVIGIKRKRYMRNP